MNDSGPSKDRDRWVDDHPRQIYGQDLPWENPRWRPDAEEPLSIGSVLAALMSIREGKSHELKPGSALLSREEFSDPANFVEVDRPPESAVRVITRALQAGAKGEKLIKKALELKPPAKGAILARHIARELTEPRGGWPNTAEDWDRFNMDTVEWIKPSKSEVERELESRYPEIYDSIPKKEGSGGKLLRSEFWENAGLKDAIDQARGYK